MSTLIVRLYDTAEQARAAVAKLREAGFRDDAILELAPGSAQSVASAIVAGRMMGHRAEFYAERVKQGRSLVAVEAPFGQGQAATNILDGFSPVDQDLQLPHDPVQHEWGKAAPLSATLGWPVLLRKSPAPLSDSLGLPTRSRSEFYTTTSLASSDATFSSIFGLRLLSRNPAPLSSMLGFPLLSRRTTKTSSFGMKLLSDTAAPLSSALGISTLSSNPTPLSSALGLAVLTPTN
jgi:hypothetical protein